MTEMDNETQKHVLSLPPGWKKLKSERGTYFWHKDTNRVQWRFPEEEALTYQKLKDDHRYVNVQRSQSSTDDPYNTVSCRNNTKPPKETSPKKLNNSTPPSEERLSTSPPPPPIPIRNYDEQDVLFTPYIEEESTPPPPIPEKTHLSNQLLSPSKMQQFLYSSNISDLSSISVGVKKDSIVYDEPHLKPEPPPSSSVMYDEITVHSLSNTHTTKPEFMIAANPPVGDNIKSTSLRPSVQSPSLNNGLVYDEITLVSDKKGEQSVSANTTTVNRPPIPPNHPSKSPDNLPSLPPNHPNSPLPPSKSPNIPPSLPPNHPSKSPDNPPSLPPNHPNSPLPPSKSPDIPPSLPPNHPSKSPENPPSLPANHPNSPLPLPSIPPNNVSLFNDNSSTFNNVSSIDCQSLHSFPNSDCSSQESHSDSTNSLVAADHISDDGLMTVVKHRVSTTLPRHHQSDIPALPPKRGGSVKVSRTKGSPDLSELRKFSTTNETHNKSDVEYDHLIHDKCGILQRRIDDPSYSKLSDNALLMRSGVTIEGSLMSASNSSLPRDSYDDEKTTLIHAPNVPLTTKKPQPHTYEDMGSSRLAIDDPPLVWDHSDLKLQAVVKPPSSVLMNKPKVQSPLIKPESVTDEDFQRRLERLENHYYPEIDIPSWSGQEPVLSPRRASEITRAVRSSWHVTSTAANGLPPGWKKEVNEQGQVFYWHLPTGNIQYTKPEGSLSSKSQSPADLDDPLSPNYLKPTAFAAEYMGSLEVSEDKLVKGKSVQVVFSTIDTLTNEIDSPIHKLQQVTHFKRGDRVHLQVHGMDLKWLNATDGSVVISQAINRIRVWGVGQNNNRDFGYVSRNMKTQHHECHVFRCDIAAAGLIQSLLNNHGVNRRNTQSIDGLSVNDIGNDKHQGSVLVSVPLTAAQRQRSVSQMQNENEKKDTEKYKRLEAVYLGCRYVTAPHGISVVNRSVSHLSHDKSKWIPVYVDVATSHVKILDKKTEIVLKEHRIRFLSFLGIAQDDRYCGYVVDNGDNQFQFHGFYCDPNCDRLCLALHSACQSRYQRVVDAHITDEDTTSSTDATALPRKKSSLLRRIGSWKASKATPELEEEQVQPTSRNFIVQFLGIEVVNKSKGVDVITEPLQKASKKTSGIHLVELIISGAGFTINDPQKKLFASKQISSKKITYCVRIRSHFVFIAKEGSKFMLYMFSESEVDASSLVNAVQELMS